MTPIARLREILRQVAYLLIGGSAVPLALFAAGSSSPNSPTFSPGFLIAGFICNGRKRNPIGGWLFFFYWQLYSGLLLSAVFFATNIQSYENFESTRLFALFFGKLRAEPAAVCRQVRCGHPFALGTDLGYVEAPQMGYDCRTRSRSSGSRH